MIISALHSLCLSSAISRPSTELAKEALRAGFLPQERQIFSAFSALSCHLLDFLMPPARPIPVAVFPGRALTVGGALIAITAF